MPSSQKKHRKATKRLSSTISTKTTSSPRMITKRRTLSSPRMITQRTLSAPRIFTKRTLSSPRMNTRRFLSTPIISTKRNFSYSPTMYPEMYPTWSYPKKVSPKRQITPKKVSPKRQITPKKVSPNLTSPPKMVSPKRPHTTFKKVGQRVLRHIRHRNKTSKKFLFPVPVQIVPKDFDKIKEDCATIKKWWRGINMGYIPPNCNFKCLEKIIVDMADDIGIKIIGRGQYGAVFTACKTGKDCNYILKIQLANDYYRREVYAFYDLNGWEYSPIIYDAWTCGEMGFIILEKLSPVESCLLNIREYDIEPQMTTIIKELHDRGWVHVDTHVGNIMCKNGHLALVDFGWASKTRESKYGFINIDKTHPVTVMNDQEFVTLNDLQRYQINNMKNAITKLELKHYALTKEAKNKPKKTALTEAQIRRYTTKKTPLKTFMTKLRSIF